MKRKIITTIVILLIAVVAAVIYGTFFATERPLNCCHGEQYDLKKEYVNDKYGFRFQYPAQFSENIEHDNLENAYASIAVHVIDKAINGFNDFTDAGAKGHRLVTNDNKDIEFLGLDENNFVEKNIGDYKLYTFEDKTFATSYYALIVKEKMSVLVGVNPLNRNVQSDDILKMVRQDIISSFKFTPLETAIDTSNWKTYRNEKYGFEFKYPPMQSISEKNNQISLIQNRAGSDAGITMSFEFSNLDLKQFVEEYKKEIFPYNTAPILKQENYSYNGTEGVRLLVNNAMDFPTYYFFYNKGETSLIVHYKGSEQEKILSTFKFTK